MDNLKDRVSFVSDKHKQHKEFIMAQALTNPSKSLLSPQDHSLIMIDHQSQMAFATRSIDVAELRNNCALISRAARAFEVPVILTTVAEKSFSGPVFPEIRESLSEKKSIDRTTMNCWEDKNFIAEVNKIGKNRLVFAGLWTSICVADPVLSALEQGYEAYVITDACGDITKEAHKMALQRMLGAGMKPLTSMAYLMELQRDWARQGTYERTAKIAKDHGGSYGVGIDYANSMFMAKEGHRA